jgi:tRNA splicing endonuclease
MVQEDRQPDNLNLYKILDLLDRAITLNIHARDKLSRFSKQQEQDDAEAVMLSETGTKDMTTADWQLTEVADDILEILEKQFRNDRKAARHLLFFMIMSYFRSKAMTLDMTNDSIAKVIVNELNSAMISHFGLYNSREIWKEVFTAIVREDLVSSS